MYPARERLAAWFGAVRRRRRWVDHLVRAVGRYRDTRGGYLAAAITYFSFLALFPVVLLGMSVSGFVLLRNPDLLERLQDAIRDAVPGPVGGTLVDAVNGAIRARGTIGVFGLVGTLYAGLGWVDNLRTASQSVWQVTDDRSYVGRKLGDLAVLAGLGVACVLSLALTVAGTIATHRVVDTLGLDGVTGVGTLTRLVGVLLALAADTLVAAWLFARLPRQRVPLRDVARGAALAAVGIEVLKVVGTYYTQAISHSPTAGFFGNVIGLLVWLNLVARFLLLALAWTATSTPPPQPTTEPQPTPPPSTLPPPTTPPQTPAPGTPPPRDPQP